MPSTAPSSGGNTTFGSVANLRPRSFTICELASRTAASITSAMADLPYRRLRCATGTLPGRKPRSCTRPFRSSSRALTLASRSVAGTTTRNSRFSPAAAVSVTSIGTTLHGPFCGPKYVVASGIAAQDLDKPPGWCGRRGSNPHDFRHGILSPARLPIPPRPQHAGRPPARLYHLRHAGHHKIGQPNLSQGGFYRYLAI